MKSPRTIVPVPPLPSDAPKRGRQTVEARLQRIIHQQAELAEQMKTLAAQQRADARKRQLQLEAMIGAALRGNESMREFVQEALEKHFHDEPAKMAFLKSEGWVK